jgi:enoyl-CoA hydratase/carnithine racemase
MEVVSMHHDGALAILTLNNPPANVFSRAVADQLTAHVKAIGLGDARAMLMRCEGPNFCAGADVNMFVGLDRRTGRGLVADALAMMTAIENLPIPTVVAVKGMCIAAGMEIMLAHDIVFAARTARIGQIEAMIGTTTLAGGAQRIVARAGVARAKQMVFEAKSYFPETLQNWNIVNHTVEDDRLDAEALDYARRLANGPTTAVAIGKAAINSASAASIGAGDRVLSGGASQVFETGDKKRGVEAFFKMGAKAFADGAIAFEGK